MESQTIFVFFALILTPTTQSDAKSYRKDYKYDNRTDAFYKLHVDLGTLPMSEVCANEGADLIPPKSKEELKMSCQVSTRAGYVETSSDFRDEPLFFCKVDAKDVTYDSKCRVHAKGYRYFPSVGSCYKVPLVAYSWYEAVEHCHAEGAHLAVINNEKEVLALKDLLSDVEDVPGSRSQSYYHIGFRAVILTTPRLIKTIFNETLEKAGFSSWATGEPNNGRGVEHCGSLKKEEMKLNDIECNVQFGFICEKETTCKKQKAL